MGAAPASRRCGGAVALRLRNRAALCCDSRRRADGPRAPQRRVAIGRGPPREMTVVVVVVVWPYPFDFSHGN